MKLVGERRALASIVMAFYFLYYLVMFLLLRGEPQSRMFAALGGVYGLAFFALVAGYFWARWYAVGVGLFGVIVAAVGLWQTRGDEDLFRMLLPILLFVGGTHLAATLMLWGNAMSQPYDGQTAWRERFHMDDNAVQRLGRAVIRAGLSLPFVLLYALAPKQDVGSILASIVALALTGLGVSGLVRLKTWGVLALGAAGVLLTVFAGVDLISGVGIEGVAKPAFAGALLLAAALPFATPIARWIAPVR